MSTSTILPDTPSMPAEVVVRLEELLRATRCYLEFGGGGSTVLAATLGVRDVITVESDRAFLDQVEERVGQLDTRTRLHPVYSDIGPTGDWGKPVDSSGYRRYPDYALSGFAAAAESGLRPQLVLVDGRFRVACFVAALLTVRRGVPILFDDYVGRSRYHVVEELVEPTEIIERTAFFERPARVDARAAAFMLAKHSVYPKS